MNTMKLMAAAALMLSVTGCVTPSPVTVSARGFVELHLMPDYEVLRICASISDSPMSGACVIRSSEGAVVRCSVVAPDPVSVNGRENLYYLGSAVYQCLMESKK